MKKTLHVANIFEANKLLQHQDIVINNGKIAAISAGKTRPTAIHLLAPGFTDLQVNGGGGVLFNTNPSAAGVQTIVAAHRKLGTAAIMPTIITDYPKVIESAAMAIIELKDDPGVLGIHIEGPHINPLYKGTHDPKRIRPFDSTTLSLIERLRKSDVKVLLTLAPELIAAPDFAALIAMEVKIFAGHSAASFATTNTAIKQGLTGFTHLYNGMPPMTSRNPGIVAAAILSECFCSFIVDGYHVHYPMLELALKARPKQDTNFIISDAMPTVGGAESFNLYGQEIVVKNRQLTNHAGVLAGAHLDMLGAFRNLVQQLQIPLEQAIRMGTYIPRLVIGESQPQSLLGCSINEALALDVNLQQLVL